MRVVSHRGYWRDDAEKNSLPAFERSFALRFGIETDLRDAVGRLVVSHGIPIGALRCRSRPCWIFIDNWHRRRRWL